MYDMDRASEKNADNVKGAEENRCRLVVFDTFILPALHHHYVVYM
jgi:hypothetical protein